MHHPNMKPAPKTWQIEFHAAFVPEFAALPRGVQDELLARSVLLRQFGPDLGRPWADTLKGSSIANLKELRFDAEGGVWRVLFAFDGRRVAMLLAAGDKRGVKQERFYKALIAAAETRWQG